MAPETWHGKGSPKSQCVNVPCVLEKHVYLLLSVFQKKGINPLVGHEINSE